MNRQSSLTGAMREAAGLCLRRAPALLGISALTVLPLGVVLVLADIGFRVADSLQPLMNDGRSFADDVDQLGPLGLLAGVFCIAAAVVAPLGVGAMTRIATGDSAGSALKSAWDRYDALWVTVVAAAVVPVAVFVGLVALGVSLHVRFIALGSVATVAALRLLLAPCAVMIDKLGPIEALHRSWDLTAQRGRAQQFGLLAIVVAVSVLGTVFVAAGLAAGISPDLRVSLRVGEAFGALAAVFASPYAAVVVAIIYKRWRHDPGPALPAAPAVPAAEHERWSAWVGAHVADPARRPVALAAALRTVALGGSSEQAAHAAWSAAWS